MTASPHGVASGADNTDLETEAARLREAFTELLRARFELLTGADSPAVVYGLAQGDEDQSPL